MTDYSYLNSLNVTGPISERVVPERTGLDGYIFMIMGPTGSGKSNFIEALVGNREMGISKDQLEGYTQNITAYQLINIRDKDGDPLYILDTPGFGDAQISQAEIITKVNQWMEDHRVNTIVSILYFSPINATRIPGSQHKTMKMLRSLTRNDGHSSAPGGFSVITTMWDLLWKESQISQAEKRFSELKDNIWKDVVSNGGFINKFNNTQESALSIIDRAYGKLRFNAYFANQLMSRVFIDDSSNLACQRQLYIDLIERVKQSLQKVALLAAELTSTNTNDSNLLPLLVADLQKNEALLHKFETELVSFPNPPADLSDDPIVLQSLVWHVEHPALEWKPHVHYPPHPYMYLNAHVARILPSPVSTEDFLPLNRQAPPVPGGGPKSPVSIRRIQLRVGILKALFVKIKLAMVESVGSRRRR